MAKRTKKRAAKKRTGRRVSKKTTRKTRGKKASASNLQKLSVAELQAELTRRQRGLSRLIRRREKLMSELEEINAEISGMGGSARANGGRRARNVMTLPDALHQVLQGTTMSVTEAAEAVRAAGYQSSAANFRTMVNQALLKDDRFKKVSRGQYTSA